MDTSTPVVASAAANGDKVATPPETASHLPLGTVDGILAAPSDIKTDTIDIPEWGCSLEIRSFTAAQQARVKQESIVLSGQNPDMRWAEMEKVQFLLGVTKPRFKKEQVNVLHNQSGPGFKRVIDALDALSGIDKEKLREAQESFRTGGEQPEADPAD